MCTFLFSAAECTFPDFFTGDWFSMEGGGGTSVTTIVSRRKWGALDCIDNYLHKKPVKSVVGQNITYLLGSA